MNRSYLTLRRNAWQSDLCQRISPRRYLALDYIIPMTSIPLNFKTMDSVVAIISNCTIFVRDPCRRQNVKHAKRKRSVHKKRGNFHAKVAVIFLRRDKLWTRKYNRHPCCCQETKGHLSCGVFDESSSFFSKIAERDCLEFVRMNRLWW